MGTIDTLISLAGLTVSVSNAAKLAKLREHNDIGTYLAVQEAVVKAARKDALDSLFDLNTAVEGANKLAATDPRRAVGQLRFIEFLAKDAGFAQQMFETPDEKKFVKEFWETLRNSLDKHYATLDASTRKETDELAQAMFDLDDASLYLKYVDLVEQYRSAQRTIQSSATQSGGGVQVGTALVLGGVALFLGWIGVIGLILILATWRESLAFLLCIVPILAIAAFAGFHAYKRYTLSAEKRRSYAPVKQAKTTVEDFEKNDGQTILAGYSKKEEALASRGYFDVQQIRELRIRSEQIIDVFFEGQPSIGIDS